MPLHLIGLVHHWIHLQNANHRAPYDAVEVKPKYAFDDLAAKFALPFMPTSGPLSWVVDIPHSTPTNTRHIQHLHMTWFMPSWHTSWCSPS